MQPQPPQRGMFPGPGPFGPPPGPPPAPPPGGPPRPGGLPPIGPPPQTPGGAPPGGSFPGPVGPPPGFGPVGGGPPPGFAPVGGGPPPGFGPPGPPPGFGPPGGPPGPPPGFGPPPGPPPGFGPPPGPPPGFGAPPGGPPALGGPPAAGPGATSPTTAAPPGNRRQPVVHGYRRLRVNELHHFQIRIESEGGRPPADLGNEPSVTVQPVIPGALVTPSSGEMPLQAGSEFSFAVLPLAVGKVRNARLDIIRSGRRLTSLALPMRVNRGNGARLILWLTLVLLIVLKYPWPGLYYERPGDRMPFHEGDALQQYVLDHAAALGLGEKAAEHSRPLGDWSSFDFAIAGSYYLLPALKPAYDYFRTLQKFPLADVYVLAVMLLLALLVKVLERPAKTRVYGPMLEVRT